MGCCQSPKYRLELWDQRQRGGLLSWLRRTADNWSESLDCLMSNTLSIWSSAIGEYSWIVSGPRITPWSLPWHLWTAERFYPSFCWRINKYFQSLKFSQTAAVFLKIPFMSRLAWPGRPVSRIRSVLCGAKYMNFKMLHILFVSSCRIDLKFFEH